MGRGIEKAQSSKGKVQKKFQGQKEHGPPGVTLGKAMGEQFFQ